MSAADDRRRAGGLGRGLAAILGDADPAEAAPGAAPRDQLVRVSVDQLEPNPEQPREVFSEAALTELAASIQAHGVLLPLVARRGDGGRYVLIAGERRWRAAKLAGVPDVPVLVRGAPPTPAEMLELALIENLQRADLDPLEAAAGYQRLIQAYDLTQEQVAQRVGKDRATVANALRLLKMPEEGRRALREGRITAGHARALAAVDDPAAFRVLLATIIAQDLSVRATEELVRKRSAVAKKPRQTSQGTLDRGYQRLAEGLVRAIGNKVELKPRPDGSGRVLIEWHDRDDLERIVAILKGR